jgi:GGDEF domain-containing protein/2'-5' RNA ligase
MDNELKIFLQSFKELEILFQALPITDAQFQKLKGILSGTLKNAKNLALYDSITHALNARAGKWLIPAEQVRGMAKVDIYDLRQANKVFGALVVDAELQKLAYQFMTIFTLDKGDFVRRSPGSDEFRVFSTTKTPPEIKRLLTSLYAKQEMDSLLTWDFGTGLTESEAENELQKQRKTYRPMVVRQTILESHSEIPRRIEDNNTYQSWDEFNLPYEKLIDIISSLQLPRTVEQQAVEQVQITRNIVENIVTREPLTGTLNGLGAKWYLENRPIEGLALTDMLNMHEGNSRFGTAAIDQDLKRFSQMLFKNFPKSEGFLLFRSERAGDEFKVISTRDNVLQLKNRICRVWQSDQNHGLLTWNFGVGRNDGEAHVDLYRNRVKETEIMETSFSNGKSTFIIVRPESEDYDSLFKLSEDTAGVADGTPIIDLHLTVQAIRNVEDFDALRARLEEYASKLPPFEISLKNIARMNINNQPGRLWLLAERSPDLEGMYNDLSQIARDMGYESYPYKSQNWLPHVKIVNLPENRSTQIKDPTFGAIKGIKFTVRRFEWTVQKAAERWELLDQFSLQE